MVVCPGKSSLAAWAAAERNGAYGAGMNMVGAVAVNPIADLAPLADPDRTAALATADQYRLQIRALQSLETMQPDFDLDAHRSAKLKDQWDLLVDCAPRDVAAAQLALNQLTPNDFQARDAAAAADLKRRLGAVALPGPAAGPNDPPVLVAFGIADTVNPPAGVLSALTLYYAAYQETSIRFHLQMISRNIMVYMQSLDGEGQVAIPRESFNVRHALNYLMIDIVHRPLIDLVGVYELSKNGGPEHPAYTPEYNESMLRVEIPYNTLEARELVLSVGELDLVCASYRPGWRTHFGKVSVSLPNSLTSVAISYFYIATLLRGADVMWAADAVAV